MEGFLSVGAVKASKGASSDAMTSRGQASLLILVRLIGTNPIFPTI